MNRIILASAMTGILFTLTFAAAQNADESLKKGKAALESFEYKRALEDFTEAIRLDPKNADAYYYRGLVYRETLEPKKALADQTEAIRLNPKFVKALVTRGSLYYFATSDKTKALTDINEALKLDPKSVDAIAQRALIHAADGESAQAVADYERVIKLAPDEQLTAYLKVVKILASCSDDKVRDGKKALAYANKAWKLAGESYYAASEAVAMSYAELGEFEEAVKWQKKAITEIPMRLMFYKEKAELRLKVYEDRKPLRYKVFLE